MTLMSALVLRILSRFSHVCVIVVVVVGVEPPPPGWLTPLSFDNLEIFPLNLSAANEQSFHIADSVSEEPDFEGDGG